MPGENECAELQVAVLGPVRAWLGDREVALGPRLQRSLFAVLALQTDRVVPRGALIDALWGDQPPPTAEGGVYTYVAGLRRELGAQADLLESSRAGYRLVLAPARLDALCFERRSTAARELLTSGRPADAVKEFDAALALFGEVPLADAAGPFTELERDRLVSRRLDVVEQRAATMLELGPPDAELATALGRFADQHPLRESLHTLRMLTLHRLGGAAEALACYDGLRTRLATELGIDPGPECQRAHREILTAPRTEDRPRPPARPREVPAQLPHDVPHFVGRQAELADLTRLAQAGGAERTVVISAINGTAGVGKTALALRVAHTVREHYPDGQLYVDLRGFDPRRAPMSAGEALGHFLRALGADPQTVSPDETEQAAQYRTMLATRKILVVLDNAVSTQQVRPLLPGVSTSLVLITSRNRLGGLTARDEAHSIALDTLSPEDALNLLAGVIGEDRVRAEAAEAEEIAALCGHLPLALRVAADRVAASPDSALSHVLDELRDEVGRLDVLSSEEDPASAVRAVFSWSFRALDPASARMFRLLGLHPGAEFGSLVAAALAGCRPAPARRALDALVRGHLVELVGRDRYRCHDLLRVYAMELVQEAEPTAERTAATRRMFDWYVSSAEIANHLLDPLRRRWDVAPADPAYEPASFGSRDSAMAWCEAHLGNYAAATQKAFELGEDEYAWKLPAPLFDLLNLRRHTGQWIEMYEIGLAAARRAGERDAEMRLLTMLGFPYLYARRVNDATEALQTAAGWWAGHGSGSWHASCLQGLAIAEFARGQLEPALEHSRHSLRLYREEQDWWGIAWLLNNLGVVVNSLGDFPASYRHLSESLEVCDTHGHMLCLGFALTNIGELVASAGAFTDATGYLDRATEQCRMIGDRFTEARVLRSLAKIAAAKGLRTNAIDQLHESIELFEDIGDAQGQFAREARTLLEELIAADPDTDHSRQFVRKFRAQGGRGKIGVLEAGNLVLLTHTGADGATRTTPLLYATDGDDLLVFADELCAVGDPGWTDGVLACPDVVVERGGETFPARAAVTTGAERARRFAAAVGQRPFLAGHQRQIGHEIPLFVLEPLAAQDES